METKGRQSNIELLRLMAGIAVVILHFNYFPTGGGAIENTSEITQSLLLVLQTVCACAVNVFVLISGYFSIEKKETRTGKLISLILQTIAFQLVYTLIYCGVHHSWGIKTILVSLLPTNYFVILYCVVMFLSPFINKLFNSLEKKKAGYLTIILLVLFSGWATVVDVLKEVTGNPLSGLSTVGLDGSMGGYTIVNFILLYLIGGCIRKLDFAARIKTVYLFGILMVTAAAIFIWRKLLPNTAWTYCNPLIILEACTVFLLFSRIRMKQNRVINAIAPAAFTCFLAHQYLLSLFDFSILSDKGFIVVLLIMLAVIVAIYAISFVLMIIWNKLEGVLFKKILDKCPRVSA